MFAERAGPATGELSTPNHEKHPARAMQSVNARLFFRPGSGEVQLAGCLARSRLTHRFIRVLGREKADALPTNGLCDGFLTFEGAKSMEARPAVSVQHDNRPATAAWRYCHFLAWPEDDFTPRAAISNLPYVGHLFG